TVCGIERVQDSGRTERVHAAGAESGRSAWTRSAGRFGESSGVAMLPDGLAGADAVAGNDLVLAALLLRVKTIALDREGRPAGPDRATPELGRRRLRPVGLDPYAMDHAVTCGPTKTRPLSRRREFCDSRMN